MWTLDQGITFAQALAPVAAILIAYAGLDSWRRQMRTKINFDLAKQLMCSVYKLKDEVYRFRNPLITVNEMVRSLESHGVVDAHEIAEKLQKTNDGVRAAKVQRFSRMMDVYADYSTFEMEAEAVWSIDTVAEHLGGLRDDLEALHFAMQSMLDYWEDPTAINHVDAKKYRETITGVGPASGKDKWAHAFEDHIKQVEDWLRPKLNPLSG